MTSFESLFSGMADRALPAYRAKMNLAPVKVKVHRGAKKVWPARIEALDKWLTADQLAVRFMITTQAVHCALHAHREKLEKRVVGGRSQWRRAGN